MRSRRPTGPVTRDPLHLSDERRYDVPATVITCEYPAAMLRQRVEEGHPYAAELGRLREVTYVDLRTSHWLQLTKPEELARAVLAALPGPGVPASGAGTHLT